MAQAFCPNRIRMIFCGLIIALVIVICPPVAAVDHTLNPGDSIARNITDALPGDTLILNPGIYQQNNIDVSKNIIIRANTSSGGNQTNTIIDGQSLDGIFFFSGAYSFTLDNLTIRNGKSVHSGAIYSLYSHSISITSSTIANCHSTNSEGGAIAADTISIASSTITDCSSAGGDGAAIWASNTLNITSSTIRSCSTTGFGGAIYAYSNITMTSTSISDCTATKDGGAIMSEWGSVSISNSTITNCSAFLGGAIYSNNDPGDVTITSTTITECSASGGGAIFYLGTHTLKITSTTITDCRATFAAGGAIYDPGGGTIIVTSSTIANCLATAGGIIYVNGASVTMHFCRIYANTGQVIYDNGGSIVTAENNWWGSNADPSGLISFPHTPWLVLGIDAAPSSILQSQTSAIHANLTYDSDGNYHNPALGQIPDGTPIIFGVSGGPGSVLPTTGAMTSATSTTTFTPTGGGTSTVGVTVDGQTVNTRIVTIPVPGVNVLTPAIGRVTGGGNVTISGTGFSSATAVMFGANASPSYVVDLDTQITAVTPPHSTGTVNVTITTPGGTSANTTSNKYTYTNSPVVTGISPVSGPPEGTMVTITGMGFTGATDVKFGTISPGWWAVDNDMQITAYYLPDTPGTMVNITVITPEGTSATSTADRFTYTGVPVTIESSQLSSSTNGGDDAPSSTSPTSTNSVNVGGASAVSRVDVTGTSISSLIVTGTVQPGPGAGNSPAPGIVYQYVEIVPARYATVSGATISFTVPVAWLKEHHMSPPNIVLYHYTSGAWTALPTTAGTTANGLVTFTAATPSFSLFAIGGQSGAPAPTSGTMEVKTSGEKITPFAPAPEAVVIVPVDTRTATAPTTAGIAEPVLPLSVIAIAGIMILAGGGFLARRWWIRRQNPALFRKYD